jgi:hypothetical protein
MRQRRKVSSPLADLAVFLLALALATVLGLLTSGLR